MVVSLGSASGTHHQLVSLEAIEFGVSHGFDTGDLYAYSSGGGVGIGGLYDGQTYYVIKVSDSAIRLAQSAQDAQDGVGIITDIGAASGDSHSIGSGSTLDIGNHSFSTGQKVVYDNGGGTSIGGLADGGIYYVVKTGGETIRLAASSQDANAPIPVTITLDQSVASGESHSFSPVFEVSHLDSAGDIIHYMYLHGYETGDAVTYGEGSGGAIAGLNDAAVYYVIKLSGTAIQLAESYDDAVNTAGEIDVVFDKADLGAGVLPQVSVTDATAGSPATITVVMNTHPGSETTVQQLVDALNADDDDSDDGNPNAREAADLLSASLDDHGDILATNGYWNTISLTRLNPTSSPLPFYSMDAQAASERATFILEQAGVGSGDLNITDGQTDIELDGPIDFGAGSVTISLAGDIESTDTDQLITAGSISLGASMGHIGSETSPILLNQGAGELNANALNDIFLTETDGEMRLGRVATGSGDVTPLSDGAMIEAGDDAAGDIAGSTLVLTAGGGIGDVGNRIEIESELLRATAGAGFYLDEIGGDLNVDLVNAVTGDAFLAAEGSIIDANDDELSNVDAQGIALHSRNGAIGSVDNNLEINTQNGGVLSAEAWQDVYLNEVSDDMILALGVSHTGDIRLRTPDDFLLRPDGAIQAAGHVEVV
ncbi:MAG: hypothetical protein AB2813_10795 [Candidatus Sedimenticola endophacoides]